MDGWMDGRKEGGRERNVENEQVRDEWKEMDKEVRRNKEEGRRGERGKKGEKTRKG